MTQPAKTTEYAMPGTRTVGRVNWIGLYTLYMREVRRYLKVWLQTIGAPAVTTALYMVIFTLAFGASDRIAFDMPFSQFLAPGLIIMGMLQNSFANTTSSLVIAKVQGTIVDTLMPPLSAAEMTVGFLAGGVTRGLMVGMAVAFAFVLMPGVEVSIHSWGAVLYFAFSATLLLSSVGVLSGVWAEKFDHAALVQNFVIAPLSLLSGTFYSISRLPAEWQAISHFNPFFYMIDGFRYGFIGRADSDLMTGALIVLTMNIVLGFFVYRVFKTGYRIKA